MEKVISVQNTIEPKIEMAIKDVKERIFKVRMSFESKHGREVVTSEMRGILIGWDKERGSLKVRKTSNGVGEVVEVPIFEIEDIL